MSSSTEAAPVWPRVGVFGAGAVGCFYGARFALAGAPVTLIARPAHVDAIAAAGLRFDTADGSRRISLDASTDPRALHDADLVLFCVKTRDTEVGARLIAPVLRPGAIVVSLQNGVDNVDRMRMAAALDPLAAVVYVAASMGGPGHLVHAGRGDLVLGEAGAPPDVVRRDPGRVPRVADWFERAGIPCPVSADIRVALWTKLAINCVFNPMSALARARYARLLSGAPARALARDILAECVAVARADGVMLDDPDRLHDAALALGQAMAGASSSTAQDLAAGRPTEIDALNGHVAARGAALGIPTPVNHALWALVGLLEGSGRSPSAC